MDVKGRTAIVTGASRGIGKQIAIELGRRGARVVVAARTVHPHRRVPGSIGETVEEVERAGGEAAAVATDVRDPEAIHSLVAAALERFGPIEVLVNNAADTAFTNPPSILDLGRDEWLRQFETNLLGPFSLVQAVLPSMSDAGGGVIVNLTSGAGDSMPVRLPDPGGTVGRDASAGPREGDLVVYATSKAALNRFANVIATELAERAVAIVNVDPGFTRTELVELGIERGVVDASAAVSMAVPVKAVLHVVTCDDPMQYTGQILRAAAFVEENRL